MPFLTLIEKSGYNSRTRFHNLDEIEKFRETLRKNDIYNCLKNINHDFNDEAKTSIPLDV